MENEGGLALPDPTVDLHWDDFQGPVQYFFDQNVKAHPDRVCVIGINSTEDHVVCLMD